MRQKKPALVLIGVLSFRFEVYVGYRLWSYKLGLRGYVSFHYIFKLELIFFCFKAQAIPEVRR